MEGVVVDYVPFVQRRTQVDDLEDDPVGDDQSFRGKELGPFLQFVDLELPPESLQLVDLVVLAEPGRGLDAEVEPNVLEFVLLVVSVPHVADYPRHDGPHLPIVVEHLVAHVEGLEEHQSEQHAHVALELRVVAGLLATHRIEGLDPLDEGDDEFVVDVVELPGLPVSAVLVVLVVDGVLLDVVDVQSGLEVLQQGVGLYLVHHHQGAQLVLVHLLHLLVDVQSLRLNRLRILLLVSVASARLDVVLVQKLLIGHVFVQPQRTHVLVDGLEGEDVSGSQVHLHVELVLLGVAFQDLLAGLYHQHEVALVPAQEGPQVELALDDQLVHETETEQRGHVVGPALRVDPDDVFAHDGLLEVLPPEEESFPAVLGRGLLLLFDADLRAPAVLNVFLFLLLLLLLLIILLFFLFVQLLFVGVEVFDLVEHPFHEVREGLQQFRDGLHLPHNEPALFLLLLLLVPEDLKQFGVEVEVDHLQQVPPVVLVLVQHCRFLVEAGEDTILLGKHILDYVFVFFVEHLLLTHLHVLFEGFALNHLVEIVDLEEGVRGLIGSLVEVALVLEEVKGNHKGDVLSFGLETTVGLHLEQVVEKLHRLSDLGELVRRTQLPFLLGDFVSVDPIRRQVVRVGTLHNEIPQVGVAHLLQDLVDFPFLAGPLVVGVLRGTVDAELPQHVLQDVADGLYLAIHLHRLAAGSHALGIVSLLDHFPEDLVLDLEFPFFLVALGLTNMLFLFFGFFPGSFGFVVPVERVFVLSSPVIDIEFVLFVQLVDFVCLLGLLLDHNIN